LISELDQIISKLEKIEDSVKDGKFNEDTVNDLWKIAKQLDKFRKKVTN
jgi:hypothetical protein